MIAFFWYVVFCLMHSGRSVPYYPAGQGARPLTRASSTASSKSTNDGWTCLPNLPSHCLQPHIVTPAADAGQIHLFGYGCLHGDDGAVQTLSINRSTAEPKWSYGVITDQHLRRAAVSSMNGYLVTSGGYNGKGPSAPSDHVNMHIQCETSQQWLPISSLVTARYGARLLSADNTLIVVGGFRGTDTNAAIVREIEVLRAM